MVVQPNSSAAVCLSFNRKLVSSFDVDHAVPAPANGKIDVTKPIPLKHTWALWEQLQQGTTNTLPGDVISTAPPAAASASYGELTSRVATIADVQTFWKYFVHLPQPSQILGESKKIVRQDSEDSPAHTLAALMLFRDKIRPEWEDESNKKGGHFQFTLQFERSRPVKDPAPSVGKDAGGSNWLAQTDEYWNNIVLGLIGGSLDPNDFITGIRLVDKVKPPPRSGARPVGHIRVEVWFRDAHDTLKINALKDALEAHMRCRLDGSMTHEMFPGYRLDMRSHEEESGDKRRKPSAVAKKTAPRKATDEGFVSAE